MADIFISYKREDKKIAFQLAERLESSGWTVWWDHDLLGGEDYDTVIERELDVAKCVIVIWSALSVKSRNVRDEAKNALNRNVLVPVTFDNTEPPIGFGMTHTILFENPHKISENEYIKLYESLAKKIQPDKVIVPPKPIPPSFYKKYRYYLFAVAVIIAGYFIFKLIGGTKENSKEQISNISSTDTGLAKNVIDTNNIPEKRIKEKTQTFEEKLVLLVKDSPGAFKNSKLESLGYKKLGGLDCVAYTSVMKLSDIKEDTIYNCNNGGKSLWTYQSVINEGNDSLSMSEKFKEYKIKTGIALPHFKMEGSDFLNDRAANFHDGTTSVLIMFGGPFKTQFNIIILIGRLV
jgi:TIR domain